MSDEAGDTPAPEAVGPQTGAGAPEWAVKTVDINCYLDGRRTMSAEACMDAILRELEPHVEFEPVVPALRVARDEGLPGLFDTILDEVYLLAERWDIWLGE